MQNVILKGENFSLNIKGKLKKTFRKQVISSNSLINYFLYWYEGFVEIINSKEKSLGKFKFKTNVFRDYWTDGILSLKKCFIFYGQETLFYHRFYGGSDFIGVKGGKFSNLVDVVAKDLIKQYEKKSLVLCPIQFSLLDLVNQGFCYENKYPLDSSEIY